MSAAYFAHGATLTLAWFFAINVVLCAAAAMVAAVAIRADWLRRSSRFWMVVRLAPAAAALLFALALFVPSYWKYEPRESVEGFDVTLTLFALASVALALVSTARAAAAWTAASRRVAGWLRHAREIALPGATMPAFVVDTPQPFIALVGIVRPKLLATQGLIDALTPSELEAVVAHEVAHHRALDNLTRLLMRGAPDFLGVTTAAGAIERRWAAAAEHAADRIGGHDAASSRCALASALVKVARSTGTVLPTSEPISALISGGEIASRVQTLLGDERPRARSGRVAWAGLGAGLAAAAVAYGPLLQSVHELTEILVNSLP